MLSKGRLLNGTLISFVWRGEAAKVDRQPLSNGKCAGQHLKCTQSSRIGSILFISRRIVSFRVSVNGVSCMERGGLFVMLRF